MTASAAGTSRVYPPVISVTIIRLATGTWAAPANTAAVPTITKGAAGWWGQAGQQTAQHGADEQRRREHATGSARRDGQTHRERFGEYQGEEGDHGQPAIDGLLHPPVPAPDHLRTEQRQRPHQQPAEGRLPLRRELEPTEPVACAVEHDRHDRRADARPDAEDQVPAVDERL